MIKERLLKNQTNQIAKHHRVASIVRNILLFLGVLLIVSSLVYLLVHLDESDSLVIVLMPFFFGGLSLVIVSLLIHENRPRAYLRRRLKRRLFKFRP